jgi:hypothetical protein
MSNPSHRSEQTSCLQRCGIHDQHSNWGLFLQVLQVSAPLMEQLCIDRTRDITGCDGDVFLSHVVFPGIADLSQFKFNNGDSANDAISQFNCGTVWCTLIMVAAMVVDGITALGWKSSWIYIAGTFTEGLGTRRVLSLDFLLSFWNVCVLLPLCICTSRLSLVLFTKKSSVAHLAGSVDR